MNKHITSRTGTLHLGDGTMRRFEIQLHVDVDALLDRLAADAANSEDGILSLLGGLVVVKAIRKE
jgi:hypothetical protein